jgi:hypothetical protein
LMVGRCGYEPPPPPWLDGLRIEERLFECTDELEVLAGEKDQAWLSYCCGPPYC